MLTVKAAPVHVPGGDTGVTLYTAVAAFAVVLVSVPFTLFVAVPDAPPDKLAPEGAAQAYEVPVGMTPEGVKLNGMVVHTVEL